MTRADLEGAEAARTPSSFCRDRVPDFVWAPQAKSMHQIVQIDFENYNFSLLLRGHIPFRHPLSPQVPKFCQSLIWVPPLLKNPGSTPVWESSSLNESLSSLILTNWNEFAPLPLGCAITQTHSFVNSSS